jgi:dTDP-4-dehydrorhamnose 3,5-epimerase
MVLSPTKVYRVMLVEPAPHRDDRGVFTELWNKEIFAGNGIFFSPDQVNNSLSLKAGTVRGLHYQEEPDGQEKIVRCSAGEILDVVVDVRPQSPTYRKHVAVKLSAGDLKSVYIPRGCAHGWQALKDFSEIEYLVTGPWKKAAERGLRPTDPAIGIKWPLPVIGLNSRDAEWELLS